MNSLDQLVSSIFERRLAPFARYDLKELIEVYDDFEESIMDAVTELCADYLDDCTTRVAGNVLVFQDKAYHWTIGYNAQQRTLTVVVLPEYESKAKHRILENEIPGIGRISKVSLIYVNIVSSLFIPLIEACCKLILQSHALLEASLLGSVQSYRNQLLEGMNEIVRAWASQHSIELSSLTYAFSVSNRDTVRFNYSLSADSIREAIKRCNAAQIAGVSPFELTTALLTNEMQDAVLTKAQGDIPPITIVPYLSLKSMETNYDFWSGEHLFLGGAALAGIDIGSHRNYVLQLNISVAAKDIGTRIVNENRELLLIRFRANIDAVSNRFGGISRFTRKLSRGVAREASLEFLSDLFWKIVQKGGAGGV